MGKKHYEMEIVAALKANDTKASGLILLEWQAEGVDLTKQPLFYLSMARSCTKRKNMEGVLYNLDKLTLLQGK